MSAAKISAICTAIAVGDARLVGGREQRAADRAAGQPHLRLQRADSSRDCYAPCASRVTVRRVKWVDRLFAPLGRRSGATSSCKRAIVARCAPAPCGRRGHRAGAGQLASLRMKAARRGVDDAEAAQQAVGGVARAREVGCGCSSSWRAPPGPRAAARGLGLHRFDDQALRQVRQHRGPSARSRTRSRAKPASNAIAGRRRCRGGVRRANAAARGEWLAPMVPTMSRFSAGLESSRPPAGGRLPGAGSAPGLSA